VTVAQPAVPDLRPGPDMVWVPGGTFLMGSDHHYPEEAPAHPVTADGFWIDRHTVTNAEFARFVRKTGHVTVAERARPGRLPRRPPELLVPASTCSASRPPGRPADPYHGGPMCRGGLAPPPGPGSSIRRSPTTRWSTSPGPTWRPTPLAGQGSCRPRPSGSSPARGGWRGPSSPGATSSTGGRWMANTWQGEFPNQNLELDG
jgi:hypothetical protein